MEDKLELSVFQTFARKYQEINYKPEYFTDEELDLYIESLSVFSDCLNHVLCKLKDEQYQRRIDHMHMEEV